ncbi:hypothetical protein Leryth_026492 [Lithospermum erythrorhizon]|nr:hypothetical protein Leryth_026492 [Lithospermum erythrorhizon]
MVLLLEKHSHSSKFASKLEKKKHKKEAFLASLQAFHFKISDSLHNLEKESEFLSLKFVKRCFGLFPLMNKAFSKLVLELDCPVNKWEGSNINEYLTYNLNMLELLNSLSSCLCHLGQERLPLLHSLQLAEKSPSLAAKYLIKIKPLDVMKHFKKIKDVKESEEMKKNSDKERVIHEALVVMKSISLWLFGIFLSELGSDVDPYIEMRKLAARFDDSLLKSLDTKVEKEILEKKGELKEVKDVNIAADSLLGALGTRKSEIGVSILKARLEVLEKLLHELEKETSDLFGEMLAGRNNLLDSFRLTRKSITD